MHRDIKLGNLFLSDRMEVKVGDFGLAAKQENEGDKRRTVCGTPNYMAPEILDSNVGHSFEVDIWAVGVIMFAMIIGKPPFETPEVKSTYKRIQRNDYFFPDHAQITPQAKDIIS